MRRRLLLAPVAAALVLLTVAAHGDAPSGQYQAFGKSDPAIRDRMTLLVWERYDVKAFASIQTARDFCAALTDLPGSGRLPTVKELLTLVDEDRHDESSPDGGVARRAIDRNAFPGTPVDRPYIAESPAGTRYWYVDFDTGEAHAEANPPPTFYVRCVYAQ